MLAHTVGIETAGRAARSIGEILRAHAEWLYVRDGRTRGGVRRGELEFRVASNGLLFYCLTDEGMEVWRIRAWGSVGERLLFEAQRGAGRERAQLELIPRRSTVALAEEVSASRHTRCDKLAHLACALASGATVERASLSAGPGFNRPGAFARILLRRGSRTRIAVAGIVSGAQAQHVDALLSSTLIWFSRLRESSRAAHDMRLWIAVERACTEALRQRVTLLRPSLARLTGLYEIDDDWDSLTPVPQYELEELFEARAPRINVYRAEHGETAARIMALAPDAIDVVRARRGETLRFHGLSFARVRRTPGAERVWFGLDASSRRLLDDSTLYEWEKLLTDLSEHRRADTNARHHALYKRAPEAWLESLLRRDITRLDPGLRLAPLHAQFRAAGTQTAASRPVDLLALRRDGRLVVIELKVSEDREHVMQGADYWRRMEMHRRSGAITRARLFGDADVADEPPLVYLAAPALSFHRAFRTLAESLRAEIELYRFDLNEDWRTGVRVIRRVEI